ncbi:hypothetical protein Tco_1218829 [Tanacetum coccineum]
MFQHQGESLYDAWTRFKNLIEKVPHHGLGLWSLTQLFYYHVDNYTRMYLDFTADGNLRELSGEEAWEAIDSFAQGQKEWDKPFIAITKEELAILRAQIDELVGNKKVWVEMLMTSNNVTFIASFIPLIMKYLVKISKKNSSYLGLRKKYRLSLKNDMPPRDK